MMIEFKHVSVASCMESGIEYALIWRKRGADRVKDQENLMTSTFMGIARDMDIMDTFP
jgi:hypothetical protein